MQERVAASASSTEMSHCGVGSPPRAAEATWPPLAPAFPLRCGCPACSCVHLTEVHQIRVPIEENESCVLCTGRRRCPLRLMKIVRRTEIQQHSAARQKRDEGRTQRLKGRHIRSGGGEEEGRRSDAQWQQ